MAYSLYNNLGNSSSKKKKKKTISIADINNQLSSNGVNSSLDTVDNLTNQTVNYATRLEAINADGKDTRNPLEKILNLPEDQNFLFDIGEILDRPFNALKGGIQEAQEGGSVLEGLGSGISGEKTYYAGDILRNAGVSDDALFTNPLNGEDVSVADLLGTGLDIFADPTNYIPAGGIVKGISETSKLKTLNKAKNVVNKATDALTAVKKVADTTDTLSDAEKALNTIKVANAANNLSEANRAVKVAQDAYDYVKNMPAPNMSLQDAAIYGLSGLTKKGFGVADNLVTKGLSKLDERTLNRMVKGGASAQDLNNYVQSLDLYRDAKNSVSRTVNYGKSLPNNLVNRVRDVDDTTEAVQLKTATELKDINKRIDKYVQDNLKKDPNFIFKNSDDVQTAMQEAFSRRNKSKKTNIYDFFNNAAYGSKQSATITGNIKELQKVADDINNKVINGKSLGQQIKLTVNPINKKEGQLILSNIKGKGRTNLKDVVKNSDFKNYLKSIDVKTPLSYQLENKESRTALNELNKNIRQYMKKYREDPEFKKLYDDMVNAGQNYIDNMYKATGQKVDFNEIWSKEGYFPKGIAEKLPYNRRKVFAPAKHGGESAAEANIVLNDERLSGIKSSNRGIESYQGMLSENRRNKYANELTDLQGRIDETKNLSKTINDIEYNRLSDADLEDLRKSLTESGKKTLNKASKLKNNQILTDNTIKLKKSSLDGYTDYVSADMMKKVSSTGDTQLAKSYLSQTTSYNNTLKKAHTLENNIAKASKNGQDISKMTKQLDSLYEKAAKYKQGLDVKRAKIDGSLTKNMTSKMKKAVNETNFINKKLGKLETKSNKLGTTFEQVKQANNDMLSKLQKRLNDITIKWENADPTLDINIKSDEKIKKMITNLQQRKELLESQVGKDLFSTSMSDGLTNFMNRSANTNKDMVGYSLIFAEEGLHDDSLVRFINKDGTTKKMAGGIRVGKQEFNNMLNYMKQNKNLMPKGFSSTLDELTDSLKNSDGVFMDKTIYEQLTRNVFDNKTSNAFVQMLNKANNTFKKYSTISPGFQFRNIDGNLTNMFLSGVPLHNIPSEVANANRLLDKDYFWRLFRDGAKNAKEADDLKVINQFVNAGFLGQGKEVRDLQELVKKYGNSTKYQSKIKQVFNKVFDLNIKGNEFIDSRTRMAVLSYANKHPDYVSKLGVKSPVEAVRLVAMDPANMSPFEKNVLKKIFPFYTFTKQNLLFQAHNIMRNSSKYKELVKAFDLTYDSLDDTQYRDYQKDSMQMPVYTDENGNLLTLKSNLPASDLGEFIENPLQRLVSSTSPLIRTPFEAVTGVDTFTGEESNKSGLDYLAGILGLSNVSKVPGRLANISSDNTASQNMSNLFGSVFSYNDADKIAMSNAYEEMEEYQNYINELKAQGINVPTLAELKEQGIDVDAIKERIAEDDSMLRRLKRARQRIQKSLGN